MFHLATETPGHSGTLLGIFLNLHNISLVLRMQLLKDGQFGFRGAQPFHFCNTDISVCGIQALLDRNSGAD